MADAPITADNIREHLVARAEAYSRTNGVSLSAMSKEAVKDDRFLARAKAGSNFTIETYQRFINWLDEAERAAPSKNEAAA